MRTPDHYLNGAIANLDRAVGPTGLGGSSQIARANYQAASDNYHTHTTTGKWA
jgi:hypothetical protein